jgi:hypothetical protein
MTAELWERPKSYGVFQHSSGLNGGFVVRTIYGDWTPSPYSTEQALRTFKSERGAQNHADKLNQSLWP